ncbi:MAG: biotin--[acetyl-CoA-carboxylase] ligase [Bacteroidales bacterium]|nr:biotin--[acetyl-CoA-carboxylase] ligase [Bacteroidales bacterium]
MYIKQTYSTSSLLRELYSDTLPHLYTIRTDFQTAGRGQAGNSWESEDGKNLLFSALLRYNELRATEQWRLSMLVAVALWEVLANHLPKKQLTIKWPNDIYFGDKKLVGILIENILIGKHVGYSIAGIGVNVNQTQWQSDAPNPISMKEIMGQEFEAEALMNEWISSMKLWENCSTEALSAAYLQRLYRREGWYMYMEREVSVEPTHIVLSDDPSPMANSPFLAQFIGITPQGELILLNENNEDKTYHFKQIRFVI